MNLTDDFFKHINKLIADNPQHIVVGVSGGGDSMALAHLLNNWGNDNGVKITALIVNHNLRPNSTNEAKTVQSRLNKLGIENVILTNNNPKPDSGIQDYARNVRYKLMWDWCIDENVKHLFVAHHYDDVLETVGIRLEKSSKAFGLAGINAVNKLPNGDLIRPLLHFTKSDLAQYCNDNNIEYVNDPSNENTDFTRVQIRQKIAKDNDYKNELIFTHKKNVKIRQDIESAVLKVQQKHCTPLLGGVVKIDLGFLNESPEIIMYTMRQILMWVSGDFVPPRTEKLENLTAQVLADDFAGATLHCCNIKILQKHLWIYMENKHMAEEISTADINQKNPYMGRYYFDKSVKNNLVIMPIRNSNDTESDVPKSILGSAIGLYDGKKLQYCPLETAKSGENSPIIDNKWHLFHSCPFIY